MKITITIDTANAAFEEDYTREVERIMMDIARRVKRELRDKGNGFPVCDINGNTVGEVTLA